MGREFFPEIERIYNDAATAAGTTDTTPLFEHADAVADESLEYYRNVLDHSVEARRPMWQIMLGGVFDRHPGLKLLPTEIRVDWVPATLRHLDKVYEENRLRCRPAQAQRVLGDELQRWSVVHPPVRGRRCATRSGWRRSCFGRDYPHPEGTWPCTTDFLRVAFDGVPEHEVRLMLGENAIRFLELDRTRLAQIAKRIGPDIERDHRWGARLRPEIVEASPLRSGFLKPSEGDRRIPELDLVLREDLAGITA